MSKAPKTTTDTLVWVANCSQEAYYKSSYFRKFLRGEPMATPTRTVEDLKKLGMFGLYEKKTV